MMEKQEFSTDMFNEMITQISNKLLVIDIVLNLLIDKLVQKGLIDSEEFQEEVNKILKDVVEKFEQKIKNDVEK